MAKQISLGICETNFEYTNFWKFGNSIHYTLRIFIFHLFILINQLINQLVFEKLSDQVNYLIDFLVLLGIPETALEPNFVQDCARKSTS